MPSWCGSGRRSNAARQTVPLPASSSPPSPLGPLQHGRGATTLFSLVNWEHGGNAKMLPWHQMLFFNSTQCVKRRSLLYPPLEPALTPHPLPLYVYFFYIYIFMIMVRVFFFF